MYTLALMYKLHVAWQVQCVGAPVSHWTLFGHFSSRARHLLFLTILIIKQVGQSLGLMLHSVKYHLSLHGLPMYTLMASHREIVLKFYVSI